MFPFIALLKEFFIIYNIYVQILVRFLHITEKKNPLKMARQDISSQYLKFLNKSMSHVVKNHNKIKLFYSISRIQENCILLNDYEMELHFLVRSAQ